MLAIDSFELKAKRFNKIVIWGLRNVKHTHRFIHHHFFYNLKRLGLKTVWVDDSPQNRGFVEENDLVITVNLASTYLPIKKNVFYCLHNCDFDEIDSQYKLILQVYTSEAEIFTEKWDEATFYDPAKRKLFQPWGTDLLPWEFYEPVKRNPIKVVFWVGSVWNNELNQGNESEIKVLRRELNKHKIKFFHVEGVPDRVNTFLVRNSYIAPAIGGQWQVDHNYLPCRLFKNVSYGQLGISNVPKVSELLRGCSVSGTIGEIIEKTLSFSDKQYRELVSEQQKIVKKHTYMTKLFNIMSTFYLYLLTLIDEVYLEVSELLAVFC